MTTHQALKLVNQYYGETLRAYDREFLKTMLDGLDGLGDVSESVIEEYLTQKQVNYAWKLANRFGIKKSQKYAEI